MQTHIGIRIIIWLGLVLFVSGCGAGQATPDINPTQGVVLLKGLYTTTITTEDLANDQALDPNLPAMAGNWRVMLYGDGKFDAEVDGLWVGSGIYTVRGSEVTIYISSVCDDCPCDESIGRYTWLLKDNQLLMAKRAGTCDLMHTLFTTHPLTRQP
jgi:hypothetical protein